MIVCVRVFIFLSYAKQHALNTASVIQGLQVPSPAATGDIMFARSQQTCGVFSGNVLRFPKDFKDSIILYWY